MKDEMLMNSPFAYLKNRDGDVFDKAIIERWHQARAYVLKKLKDIKIGPTSKETLKVVVLIDNENQELMLSVVRHLALAAHYTNYVECDEYGTIISKNRTGINIVSQNNNLDEELKKEEYLNNLLKYCQYKKDGKDVIPSENLIPIDIDLNITNVSIEEQGMMTMDFADVSKVLSTMKESDIYDIDTRMAVLCENVYNLGCEIDNLPYEDIHDLSRYSHALNVFQYNHLREAPKSLVTDKWIEDQVEVKNGLSNIFCADRFLSIRKGIKECVTKDNDENSFWNDKDLKLAISEHTRWNVEKLILGFRPMNDKERNRYESLMGEQRKAYKKLLKTEPDKLLEKFHDDYSTEIFVDRTGCEHIDPSHCNLCSFKDLRRIDPDNRKYDSFLMLAIPKILEKVKEDD